MANTNDPHLFELINDYGLRNKMRESRWKQIQVGAEDFPSRLSGQFGHEALIVARPPDLFVSFDLNS